MLAYWIEEREAIRVLKEDGEPRPWSDDRVFQTTYFTNVHREDDRVTKWVRENYTYNSLSQSLELGMVAARIFNYPPTLLRVLGYLNPYRMNTLASMLEDLQKEKIQIWGGAYLITTHGQKMSKIDYCVELLQEANMLLPYKHGTTCREYYDRLMIIDGIGSFLAAQVVADLKNTEGHVLQNADDRMSFSAPGPGSLRGLAWYWEHDKVTPGEYPRLIRGVADDLYWIGEMQDLQNCMCEFDKYCRVLTGTGRSKRKYNGGN